MWQQLRWFSPFNIRGSVDFLPQMETFLGAGPTSRHRERSLFDTFFSFWDFICRFWKLCILSLQYFVLNWDQYIHFTTGLIIHLDPNWLPPFFKYLCIATQYGWISLYQWRPVSIPFNRTWECTSYNHPARWPRVWWASMTSTSKCLWIADKLFYNCNRRPQIRLQSILTTLLFLSSTFIRLSRTWSKFTNRAFYLSSTSWRYWGNTAACPWTRSTLYCMRW